VVKLHRIIIAVYKNNTNLFTIKMKKG